MLLQVGCTTLEPAPLGRAGTFELRGKVSVADGSERFSARLLWQQRSDGFAMELWGPLGQGRVRLQGDSERLAIVDGRGQVVAEGAPDAVMREQLGWTLPLAALTHWARGTPVPDYLVSAQLRDVQGRLVGFEQLGWVITCDDHQLVAAGPDAVWLPARLIAQRPGYRVRLVVSGWRL